MRVLALFLSRSVCSDEMIVGAAFETSACQQELTYNQQVK